MIAFDKETCTDFETALSKEWLETNGIGGFASSTIISCNTRRYHGLLVASMPPDMTRLVILTYKVRKENSEAELVIRPFMTGRYVHVLHQENPSLQSQADVRNGVVIVAPYPGIPTVYMHQNAREYIPGFNWYRQMEYARERDRGMDFREDTWSPGEFHFTLKSNQEAVLVLTTEGSGYFDSTFLLNAERARRQKLLTGW